MPDTAVDLIKDLTDRLGAMATEFGTRAAAMQSFAVVPDADDDPEAQLTRRAQQVLADRKARRRYFPVELFHEPAWDMLMGLFISRHDPRPVNVKTLATFADAPITTSQRWIDHLFKIGLIARTADVEDRRRVEVSLTDRGREAIAGYLSVLPAPVTRDLLRF